MQPMITNKLRKFFKALPLPTFLRQFLKLYIVPKGFLTKQKIGGKVTYSQAGQDIFVLSTKTLSIKDECGDNYVDMLIKDKN
jgi:hypothetical protein